MDAARDMTPDSAGHDGDALTDEQAVRLARAYVDAYNRRELEAMIALMDEQVVSYPSRMFGTRENVGHEGVRAWWQAMVDSGRWYEVAIKDVRRLEPDRVAVLGEIFDQGEPLSPWGVVVRVRNGLIVESRSYLSDEELLDEVGLLE
jgi:ketosteroid isomerase-like protein